MESNNREKATFFQCLEDHEGDFVSVYLMGGYQYHGILQAVLEDGVEIKTYQNQSFIIPRHAISTVQTR